MLIRDERGFDQWGIDIKCSFRDGDALQSLTGSHQSGGVRDSESRARLTPGTIPDNRDVSDESLRSGAHSVLASR